MASFGLIFLGPSQHLWFSYLSRILPKRDVLTTVKKIMMGQALFGPFSNTVFYSYNAALQGITHLLYGFMKSSLFQICGRCSGILRWKFGGNFGKIEAGSSAYAEKWTFVLASLWFCDIQVCARSSPGKTPDTYRITFVFQCGMIWEVSHLDRVIFWLQPLMNSSCAYIWTIYLTYMANQTKADSWTMTRMTFLDQAQSHSLYYIEPWIKHQIIVQVQLVFFFGIWNATKVLHLDPSINLSAS